MVGIAERERKRLGEDEFGWEGFLSRTRFFIQIEIEEQEKALRCW